MSLALDHRSPRFVTLDPAAPPDPPGWALALTPMDEAEAETSLCIRRGPGATLITATSPGARNAGPDRLTDIACAVYNAIRVRLASEDGLFPIRFWNHIPGIGEDMGDGLDRYRLFNVGRKRSLAAWMDENEFDRLLPTATGVGHDGDDLVVHCLASAEAGAPLENPRQRPAYRYSARFGPASPSFARATRAQLGPGRRDCLMIGGAASVRGEDSMHEGDLEAQLGETITNLRALLMAAAATDDLGRLSSVRIYHRREEDASTLAAGASRLFGGASVIEMVRADICRPELLVEIEALAETADACASTRAAGAGAG